MKLTDYKGYSIHVPTSGGKAGKGRNRTSTIQICKTDGGRVIVKQIRFVLYEPDSRINAMQKAKDFILANPISP